MNSKIVSSVAHNISTVQPKHLCESVSPFMKLSSLKADTFTKSTPDVKNQKSVCENIKSTVTDLFNKYFKKINSSNNFVEGINIEKCEDSGLLSGDLVNKIKSSGDIFTTKDLFQMQEMHDLGIYSLDDIIKFRGSEVKLANVGRNINFKKEAELTSSLEEYVENISHFVKKDPQALEVSTKNIDKYIALKGEPIQNKTLYRGIIDDEEITRILSRMKSDNSEKYFYSPNRITSTSMDISEAARASKNKLVLKIDVPNAGTSQAAKSIDINKYYDSKHLKNDFAFQKEVLLPSDCRFQLLNAEEKNGTIFVNAKLV